MAASRNWVKATLAVRTRLRMSGAVLASVIFAVTLGALNFAQPAYAAGEGYVWASQDVIHVNGGLVGQPNPVIDYFNLTTLDSGKSYSSPVLSSTNCEFILTVNGFSSDHSTGTAKASVATKATFGQPLCSAAFVNSFATGKVTVGNSATFWQAEQNNAGCPGSSVPTAPPTANYPCPDGGSIVKGVYYPDNITGKIEGTVTRRDDSKNPKVDGCRNSTVNVTRLTGSFTGDTSVKTDSGGKFSMLVGTGTVTLSTPDCTDAAGNKYSGSSKTITVTAHGVSSGAFEVTQAAVDETDICDTIGPSLDLDYFFCSIAKSAAKAAEGLDDAVLSMLKIDTDTIFNDSGSSKAGNAYFIAWSAFRNIAYAILVLFALIMIASQILGLDAIDAYTFRKTLPRLILATIFIAVSWNAMDFFFNLSNDAADAIRAIIAAPFKDIPISIGNTTSNEISLAILLVAALPTLTIGGAVAIALLGVGGIAALLGTVVLAVFSAWVLLVGRNIVADLLIIMSPVAIVFWAFGR